MTTETRNDLYRGIVLLLGVAGLIAVVTGIVSVLDFLGLNHTLALMLVAPLGLFGPILIARSIRWD